VDYHQSFSHLLHDLLENLFHFEGKFFASVAWLIARPGHLTREFIAGRRQSQLNPLRFYLFVSVLFFLVLTLLNHGHLFSHPENLDADARRSLEATAALKRQPPGSGPQAVPAPVTIAGNPASPGQTHVTVNESSEMGRKFAAKLRSGELTLSGFLDALEHRAPTVLFLAVPFFALLLKLVYVRSKRFYIEHLIFSLHLHTWGFMAVLLIDGYGRLARLGPGWLLTGFGWLAGGWMLWYLLRAFRAVYGQTWRKTVLKCGLLAIGYGSLLLLMTAATFLFTLWSLTMWE
jgi:hypothetical protein